MTKNRYTEFTMANWKKWDIIRHVLEQYETIDKAIKLIEDNTYSKKTFDYSYSLKPKFVKDLLEILRGDDKE